jgi:hypothetical protein
MPDVMAETPILVKAVAALTGDAFTAPIDRQHHERAGLGGYFGTE